MRVFSTAAPRAAAPPAAASPIFICGMFRSGSTLTEQILAGHPRVTTGGELDLLPHLVETGLQPFPNAMSRETPASVARLAQRYLTALAGLFPGAEWVTDKRCENFLLIGLIKTLFPAAKIVHTSRDALDNCLSIYFLHLDQRFSYALDLMHIGHYYRQYLRLMAHWKTLYGDDLVEVDYDALVRDPRSVAARALEALGFEWDERCLGPLPADRAIKTASVSPSPPTELGENVLRPPEREKVAAGRMRVVGFGAILVARVRWRVKTKIIRHGATVAF